MKCVGMCSVVMWLCIFCHCHYSFLYSDSKLDVAVQVSDLENGSWETDRKFVVELDGARKAIQRERVGSCVCHCVILHMLHPTYSYIPWKLYYRTITTAIVIICCCC